MRRILVALLALPNLAAALSSTSQLFLPGPLWNVDQRLVSSMGQDATATTWAVTCTANATATTTCNIPSPYNVYTIGVSTMHMSFAASQPSYDIACTLTSTVAGFCSGHVTGIAFSTALNANYLSSYGYREVTITDNLQGTTSTTSSTTSTTTPTPTTTSHSSTSTSTSTSSSFGSSSGTSSTVSSTSLEAPSSVPTGILVSFPSKTSTASGKGSGTGTGTGTAVGVGVKSTSKSAGAPAPMKTGAMGMMAVVGMVGGAFGF